MVPDEANPRLPAEPPRGVRQRSDGEVVLEVVIEDGHSGRGRLTVLALTWHPADPLAVALRLSASPDHPALPRGDWVVLRDFLRYGLDEPTGDGVVRLRPDDLRDRLWLELERYGRPACVSVARAEVRAFLDRTEQQVPAGAERSHAALDELLARLLRS